MKIVDINTLKGSDRHGSCIECEKDFAEDKGTVAGWRLCDRACSEIFSEPE